MSDPAVSHKRVVIIRLPKADVFTLTCHLQNQIQEKLLFIEKVKARTIFLDIPGVVVGSGSELFAAIPGPYVYMFIGWYSTSSFAGKDKKGSFKLHRGDKNACQALAALERTIN